PLPDRVDDPQPLRVHRVEGGAGLDRPVLQVGVLRGEPGHPVDPGDLGHLDAGVEVIAPAADVALPHEAVPAAGGGGRRVGAVPAVVALAGEDAAAAGEQDEAGQRGGKGGRRSGTGGADALRSAHQGRLLLRLGTTPSPGVDSPEGAPVPKSPAEAVKMAPCPTTPHRSRAPSGPNRTATRRSPASPAAGPTPSRAPAPAACGGTAPPTSTRPSTAGSCRTAGSSGGPRG